MIDHRTHAAIRSLSRAAHPEEYPVENSIILAVLSGFARHLMTGLAGYLVAKRIIDNGMTDQFVAGGVATVALLWSWWQKIGSGGVAAGLHAFADWLDGKGTRIVGAAAIALLVAMAVHTDPAAAQSRAPVTRNPAVGAAITRAATGRTTVSTITTTVSGLLSNLNTASLADLQFASYAASHANTDGGNVRAACYVQIIALVQAQQGLLPPTTAPVAGPPASATTGPPPRPTGAAQVFTDFEQLAQLTDALQSTSPLVKACSPVANGVKMQMQTMLSTILTGGLSLASFGF